MTIATTIENLIKIQKKTNQFGMHGKKYFEQSGEYLSGSL